MDQTSCSSSLLFYSPHLRRAKVRKSLTIDQTKASFSNSINNCKVDHDNGRRLITIKLWRKILESIRSVHYHWISRFNPACDRTVDSVPTFFKLRFFATPLRLPDATVTTADSLETHDDQLEVACRCLTCRVVFAAAGLQSVLALEAEPRSPQNLRTHSCGTVNNRAKY